MLGAESDGVPVLTATALGIVVPVLKEAAQLSTLFGSLVVVACSIAEFGSIVLLSLFFSGSGSADPCETILEPLVLAMTVLVMALLVVTDGHGLDAILGAFMAGVLVAALTAARERDSGILPHPDPTPEPEGRLP